MRFVLCAFTVIVMLPYDVARLQNAADYPLEFFEPSPLLNLLPIPFPLPIPMHRFRIAMTVLGILASIGLFTRPALLLYVIGYWYMGSAISAWGYITHSRIVPLQVLAILTAAPGTTYLSVDRLLLWSWRRYHGDNVLLLSALKVAPVARWGKQLILVLLVTIFLSAGISKLRHGGMQWADGRTLGFYLSGGSTRGVEGWKNGFSVIIGPNKPKPEIAWKDGFGLKSYLYHTRPTRLGRTVAKHPLALIALSVFTLLFELGAPLLLTNKWTRNLYLISAIGFFIGIHLTMAISFLSWIPVFLCLIDWIWLLERLRIKPLTKYLTGLTQQSNVPDYKEKYLGKVRRRPFGKSIL
jgi:hypothetical protein